MRRSALLPLLFWCSAAASESQISPLANPSAYPQAATRDELDRVGEIYESPDAKTTVELTIRFVHDYAGSAFTGYVEIARMEAFSELGRYADAAAAASRVLQIDPRNIAAIVVVAEIDARDHSGESGVRARKRALEALDLLRQLTMPQGALRREWLATKKDLLARSHSVLGYLAFQEHRLPEALTEFQTAAQLAPQGIYFYRCGLIYRENGKRAQAIDAFRRARELGPEPVSRAATRSLEEFGAKQ
jgi:tetratricopeptide (TPR) repeat protein